MFDSAFDKNWTGLLASGCAAAGLLLLMSESLADDTAAQTGKLVSIALSPLTFSGAPGATQRLTVLGKYQNGSVRALLNQGEAFVSSDTAIATVSKSGIVTVVPGAVVTSTALIGATNKATGITTLPKLQTVVTVSTPSPNSANAAATTAEENSLCWNNGNPAQPGGFQLGSFYWEIGDQNGVLASGSVGMPTVLQTTEYSIASATKMLYAAYVTQVRGGADNLELNNDIPYLNFTSGYTYMTSTNEYASVCPPTTVTPDTIAYCLTLTDADGYSFSAQNQNTIGKFDYNDGHMENHANQQSMAPLGTEPVRSIASLIDPVLGPGISLTYTEPLMSGGVMTTAATYAMVLRNILNGSLAFHDALGINTVCTNSALTSGCPAPPGGTPFPDEAWDYSMGHWVEDYSETGGDGAFSSGGTFGFYPWIDSTKSYYGIVSHYQSLSGYPTVQCGRLIRRAFMTGIAQTGTIPCSGANASGNCGPN